VNLSGSCWHKSFSSGEALVLRSGLSRRVVAPLGTILLLAAAVCPAAAASTAQKKQLAREQFEAAERSREELNNRPPGERTPRDYQRVADLYRRVYYLAPTSSKADSAVTAVAELLTEAGRRFHDARMLDAAVGQYEFLCREYPGSKYRVDALFFEAQIYQEDLGDRVQARATFAEFLRRYPRSVLAGKARAALAELEQPPKRGEERPGSSRQQEARGGVVSQSSGPTSVTSGPGPVSVTMVASQSRNGPPGEPTPSAPVRSVVSEIPAVRPGTLQQVINIRYWSTPDYTRVVIDLEDEVRYQAGRVPSPDRIFFDLHDTKLGPALVGKSFEVDDGFLRKIRVAQYQKTMTRVVLEVDDVSDYSAFLLPNPSRLIIDIHGRKVATRTTLTAKNNPGSSTSSLPAAGTTAPPAETAKAASAADTRANSPRVLPEPPSAPVRPSKPETGFHPSEPKSGSPGTPGLAGDPWQLASKAGDRTTAPLKFDESIPRPSPTPARATKPPESVQSAAGLAAGSGANSSSAATRASAVAPPSQPLEKPTPAAKPPLGMVGALGDSKVNESRLQEGSQDAAGAESSMIARLEAPELKSSQPTTAPTFEAVAPRAAVPHAQRGAPVPPQRAKNGLAGDPLEASGREARPTAEGSRSLTRALGLKIGRIVVDAGHGGHDTGTVGPGGLEEKTLTLDVALRLGKLLENKLGAEVIYTRTDDTFIPLETRTAIANQNQADLFISIHANSSREVSARGVETYYLNFTSSADALEVAARENAVSEKSVYELQDLVKKIAMKEKIEESREFAANVQRSLWGGLSVKSPGVRNRGVRKAPFIVLIGANMPSVLAEISFLSNPVDARKLKSDEYREKIAEYLYRGIAQYANGLSGIKVAKR
jgi:N-acetylmuramoyl-L-alanine amidase